MRIEQVGGAHLFDVEEIILRGDFTQRHNLDAIRFPVRGIEKQVFEIPEPFRVTHRGAQRLDVGAALRRVGDVHDVTRVCAVAEFSISLAIGRADLFPETPIAVKGFKRVINEQAWIISRVVHNLNGSGYTTGLELEVKVSDVEYVTEEMNK